MRPFPRDRAVLLCYRQTMKKWLWLGAFTILTSGVSAEDFKLTNGQIVKGDLSRVEPDGLVLVTDSGIEKISFLLLPEETRKLYGFDLKKADEFRAQQAAMRQKALELQSAAIRERAARVEVFQQNQLSLEDQQRRVKIESEAIKATASIDRGTSKGAFVRITTQTGRAATTLLDHDTRATVSVGEGYVYELRAADVETWQGKLYPAGLYTYTTPSGIERTMRAYALTSDAAVIYEKSATTTSSAERPAVPSPK